MANATLTAPSTTQTGAFTVLIAFDVTLTGFTETDVTLRGLTQNGTTGVTFAVGGTEPNANFTLTFTVPTHKEGSFEISVTGMVTPQGSHTPEAVTSNKVIVFYDTTANVAATFGTPVYRDGGVIAVPVTFAESVIAPAKTVFPIAHVSGDALEGIAYYLLGSGTAHELLFVVPPDRRGRFRVSADGYVLKTVTQVWDNIIATAVTVAYDTTVPEIVDFDVPPGYTYRQPFRVRVALNTPVTGWHQNNTLTEIWVEEGAQIGTPTAYKWVGSTPPDIHAALPETLPTDWQQLTAPPGGHSGAWHGEAGQYFLIDWDVSHRVSGAFQITLRPENPLRGPVS